MKTLVKQIILALPLAVGWIIYTAQPTPGNFLLGYIFSVAVLMATGIKGESVMRGNVVLQIWQLIAYVLSLSIAVLKSGIEVAMIILRPSLPINPGLINIPIEDASKSDLIFAICAHGITITPGELVADYKETADGYLMVVHSLNIGEASAIRSNHSKRLKRIKGILAHD